MKITNIVLSILILLLSATAAVFSYFLFEKRSQFVTGWGKMAAAIETTAKTLDKNSGTNYGAKLTQSALAHENYDNLPQLLKVLPEQAESIIKERNTLANRLLDINKRIGNNRKDITVATLSSIDNYDKTSRAVATAVSVVISNRDRSFNELNRLMTANFGAGVDKAAFYAGSKNAFNKVEGAIRAHRTRMKAYDDFISKLGKQFGARIIAGKPEENIKNITQKLIAAQQQFLAKNRECQALSANVNRLERDVRRLTDINKKQSEDIAFRDRQITSFQRAFGLSESRGSSTPWSSGSPEARAAFKGKVVNVNTKFGYIAIDAGKYSVVQQHIGNRALEINPAIEPGLIMLVTRRNGDQEEFIARVQIAQVGENSSIANIPVDAKEIKVGDTVTLVVEKTGSAAAPAAESEKR